MLLHVFTKYVVIVSATLFKYSMGYGCVSVNVPIQVPDSLLFATWLCSLRLQSQVANNLLRATAGGEKT